jgi:hypothetical protein
LGHERVTTLWQYFSRQKYEKKSPEEEVQGRYSDIKDYIQKIKIKFFIFLLLPDPNISLKCKIRVIKKEGDHGSTHVPRTTLWLYTC